ncbi:SRPBCC family protein [Streptomyces sp. NPDC048636]|uniref:SRPBCC family protein n=1 Tax=Streptomyces sp. NPDC048636 TaxID=3155762 RepID=UPI003414BB0C
MHLSNTVPVPAPPDAVFALVNDVERVASCMPGATLDGRDGDTWRGRVKVKVGPITAAYAGTVRFLEVDTERRRLRVQARGADEHGNGDAEAEVTLEVAEAPEGARLEISTDLVIRGKIAQFGKGAIGAVSDRILQRFAQNLGGLLDQDRAVGAPASPAPVATAPTAPAAPAPSSAPVSRPPTNAAEPALDGLSLIAGPVLTKYGPLAAAFAFGLFEGWLLGRLTTQEKYLRATGRTR